jgi:hypothetical protein
MIDGRWNLRVRTPVGNVAIELDAKANGSVVSGTLNSELNPNVRITDGKLDGSTLTFSAHLRPPASTGIGSLDTAFSLKADGDAMSGVVRTSYGAFEVEAVRL